MARACNNIHNRSRCSDWVYSRGKRGCTEDEGSGYIQDPPQQILIGYLGFKARILTIDQDLRKEFEKEVPGNLEAVLRTERFNLLFGAAKEDKILHVLQGHHRDDQYETVVQRLAWGSTLAGLGGIPARNGIFCRPLLAFPKVPCSIAIVPNCIGRSSRNL